MDRDRQGRMDDEIQGKGYQLMFNLFKKPYTVKSVGVTSRQNLDVHSATWAFVVGWANAEILSLRSKNDNPSNTEIQTAIIRGRIKAMKKLIDIPNEKKGILNHE